MVGWIAAETWQSPRYSVVTNTISDMQAATAPHVWFPITCFAIGGLGSFGFVIFGLRPATAAAARVGISGIWALALSVLALGNSFPLIPCQLSDRACSAHHQPHSVGGMTDAIVASLAFLVLVFTPKALWRTPATPSEMAQLCPDRAYRSPGLPARFCRALRGIANKH